MLDLPHRTLTSHHLAKHHVFTVKMRGRGCRYEELRAVCVGSSVCHRQQERSVVLLKCVILEFVMIELVKNNDKKMVFYHRAIFMNALNGSKECIALVILLPNLYTQSDLIWSDITKTLEGSAST